MNNFPTEATTFWGREQELKDVCSEFRRTSLLTLTGTGGAGKTRLALRHAAAQSDSFTDGAWLIELAPLTDPSNVPRAFAEVFDLRCDPGAPLEDCITEFLREKKTLLVIDNCEHLLKPVADLVERILAACPGVRILATSRESLRSDREATYAVPSLALPDRNELDSVTRSSAARLFADRAEAVSGFVLDEGNAGAVAAVCRRLDGMPLAIELAAAATKRMSVEELVLWLHRKFLVLTGGTGTPLKRHQTLRSLIDWSYDLMDDGEKTVFQAVSVFRGGWTIETAARVCMIGGIDHVDVPDLLSSLVERSLVVKEDGRFRMLEAIDEYAGDRLSESGFGDAVRDAHARALIEFCEHAQVNLNGPAQANWFERFDREHENIRAALGWLTGGGVDPTAALRLVASAWLYWAGRGHLTEGREWTKSALSLENGRVPFTTLGNALLGAGSLARLQGEYEQASARLLRAVELLRRCDERKGLASALATLGIVRTDQGRKGDARKLYEEAIGIRRGIGDTSGVASCLNSLAALAIESSDAPLARELLEECLRLHTEVGDENLVALTKKNLGTVAEHLGQYDLAIELYEEALDGHQRIGDRARAAAATAHIATIVMKQGDYDAARIKFGQSLDVRLEIGDRRGHADLLGDLAVIDMWTRSYSSARKMAEDSLRIRRRLGDQWGVASSLHYLGIITLLQGEIEASRSALEECLALRERLEDRRGAVYTRLWLGNAALSSGDSDAARAEYELSLATFLDVGDRVGVAQTIEALGRLAATDRPGSAVRLLAYGDARRSELQSKHAPHESDWIEEALMLAKSLIAEESFEECWREGARMTDEEAAECATVPVSDRRSASTDRGSRVPALDRSS